MHPRDIAKAGVMGAVGFIVLAIALYALLSAGGALGQGLFGSVFGLGLLVFGLVCVVVALLLFLGGGADLWAALRKRARR